MTNYEQVAEAYNLTGLVRAKYLLYMRTRWGGKRYKTDAITEEEEKCLTGYASEWAERFKQGKEYECSDSVGQSILNEMNKIKRG